MNKESIEEFKDHLGEYIDSLNIDTIDKIELLINLVHFMSDYKENLQVLEEHRILKLKKEREEEDDLWRNAKTTNKDAGKW